MKIYDFLSDVLDDLHIMHVEMKIALRVLLYLNTGVIQKPDKNRTCIIELIQGDVLI